MFDLPRTPSALLEPSPDDDCCNDCGASYRAAEVPVDCEDCGARFECAHDGVALCLGCRPSEEMPDEADDFDDFEDRAEVQW